MRAFPVVAVIDDHELIREGLAALLGSAAYRTELYPSAEDFLAMAATSEASCLIVDMQMDGMSGVELGHRLAALGFAFPIIFLTASTDPRHLKEATELGCIAYLQKPPNARQLLELIALAVSRS